jgi:hypothetical protein
VERHRILDMNLNLHPVIFIAGLLVALGAAGLLFLGFIESGPAAMIGIVGIGLLGASAIRKPARP